MYVLPRILSLLYNVARRITNAVLHPRGQWSNMPDIVDGCCGCASVLTIIFPYHCLSHNLGNHSPVVGVGRWGLGGISAYSDRQREKEWEGRSGIGVGGSQETESIGYNYTLRIMERCRTLVIPYIIAAVIWLTKYDSMH